jgi:hypothetical protein
MSRILSCVLIALLIAAALPAAAQDGLTPEEQAALDRLVAAVNGLDDYASYTEHSRQSQTYLIIPSGDPGADPIEHKTATLDATITYVQGESRAVFATLTAEVEGFQEGRGDYAFTLTAEVRLMDGVLYVRAERAAADESNLYPVPTGWVIIDNPDYWPALQDLSLDSLLEGPENEDLFDYPDELARHTSQVNIEGDRITLGLAGPGLAAAVVETGLTDEDFPEDALAEMDAGSTLSYSATLDAADLVLGREGVAALSWTGVPYTLFAPGEARDELIDASIAFDMMGGIDGINAPVAPVQVPEPAPADEPGLSGLSNQEIGLMGRFLAVSSEAEPDENYRVSQTEMQEMQMDISAPGQSQLQEQLEVVQTNAFYPGPKSGDASVDFDVEVREWRDGEEVLAYRLVGEMRRVDGVLYVRAERVLYMGEEADLPPMPPPGWVIVEDPAQWPALEDVPLDDYLPEAEDEEDNPLENPLAMLGTVDRVTLAPAGTSLDGTPVDELALLMRGESLMNMMQAPPGFGTDEEGDADDAGRAMFSLLDENDTFTLYVILDEADTVIEQGFRMDITWDQLDVGLLSPDLPEGVIFADVVMHGSTTSHVEVPDEPLPPVEVPPVE